jgi:hypothetical protein
MIPPARFRGRPEDSDGDDSDDSDYVPGCEEEELDCASDGGKRQRKGVPDAAAADAGAALAYVLRANERLTRESARSRKLLVERAVEISALERDRASADRARLCCSALLRNEAKRGAALYAVARERERASCSAADAMIKLQGGLFLVLFAAWAGLTAGGGTLVWRGAELTLAAGPGVPVAERALDDVVVCLSLQTAALLFAAWLFAVANIRRAVSPLRLDVPAAVAARETVARIECDDRNVLAVLEELGSR